MRLITRSFREGLGDTRLAGPGLTRDQDNATLAALGLLPSAQEQLARSASNRFSMPPTPSTRHTGTFSAKRSLTYRHGT